MSLTELLWEAEMSGIEIPKDLAESRMEAEAKCQHLQNQIASLEEKLSEIDIAPLKAEAAKAMEADEDVGKIQRKIHLKLQKKQDLQDLIDETQKLLKRAEGQTSGKR